MKWLAAVVIPSAIALGWSGQAYALDYLCKIVDGQWTWFGDHVAVTVTYIVVGSPGRAYETGTGVFIGGWPWGGWAVHSGTAKFSAYGIGALHVRKADDGEPFKVCATVKDLNPVTILRGEF